MTDSLARMLEGPDAEIDRLCERIADQQRRIDELEAELARARPRRGRPLFDILRRRP